MTPAQIWEKMIKGKVYSKVAVTTRVNTVFAVRQLNDEEYVTLIELIETTYIETV